MTVSFAESEHVEKVPAENESVARHAGQRLKELVEIEKPYVGEVARGSMSRCSSESIP